MIRYLFFPALALFGVEGAQSRLHSQSRQMMGTIVAITLSDVTEDMAKQGFSAAFAEFDRVDDVMSEWRPESILSTINAKAGFPSWVRAPPDLCAVLRESLDAAKKTHGLFDPSWAALRRLWQFGSDQTGTVPAPAEVKRSCRLVSYEGVMLRSADAGGNCDVRLKRAGMQLGLGGVAKGWAVDRATAALRRLSIRNFLVHAGGDLYAAGKRGDRAWRVGVRDPRGKADQFFAEMDVSDAAFSTSGDYERYFIANGTRYHHIIDPRTCYPATQSRAATILAQSAVAAEFLTKATFILGGEPALKLAEKWGAGLVLVTSQNQVLVSESLRDRLSFGQPTP